MLRPLEENTLDLYLKETAGLVNQDALNALLEVPGDDIKYRWAVYVISALWGWLFVENMLGCSASLLNYDRQEEMINFRYSLLAPDIQKSVGKEKLEAIWKILESNYTEADLKGVIDKELDFAILDQELKKICSEFDGKNGEKATLNAKELLGKYLYVNGELDEARCKAQNDMDREASHRLLGYPLAELALKMKKFGDDWVRAVLYAIDFGKGAIVSRITEEGGKRYYFSLIHAGEQNYKYLENTYFPFLYGLFYIEFLTDRKEMSESCAKLKKEFVKRYLEYWKKEQKFYLDSDIELKGKMSIRIEFENVLLRTAWGYFANSDFERAISLAKEIVQKEGLVLSVQ